MSTEGKEQALHMWRHRESDRNDVKMSVLRMYISTVHHIKPKSVIVLLVQNMNPVLTSVFKAVMTRTK